MPPRLPRRSRVNLAAIAEGVYRYRFNHDANQRRRIRMAVYTAVPGVLAYAIKDGVPIVAMLAGAAAPRYPRPVYVVLQALVLLPAFGLVYAVGVARVLGPASRPAPQPAVRAGAPDADGARRAAGIALVISLVARSATARSARSR